MKLLSLTIALIVSYSFYAQELTDITNITGDGWQTIGHAPIQLAEELIEDEGRYYIVVRGDEVRRYVDLDFDDIPYGYDYVLSNGDTIHEEFNYLLEYEPGIGIVDYTAFSGIHDLAIDKELMAISSSGEAAVFDGEDIVIQDLDYYSLAVYDKFKDSLLWRFDYDRIHSSNQIAIGIEDDNLYYAYTFRYAHTFMGDSMVHKLNGPTQFTTVVHKINWKTETKEWSRYIATPTAREDIVEQIIEMEDGSIMLDISTWGPFHFQHEPKESDKWYTDGLGKVIAKVSADGNYINHTHINAPGNARPFLQVKIDESGKVAMGGAVYDNTYIQLDQDSIYFNETQDPELLGMLFVYDEDLVLKWYKIYDGNENISLQSCNFSRSGGIIAPFQFTDDLILENAILVNEWFDWTSHSRCVILEFDSLGNMVKDPLKMGVAHSMHDVISHGTESYVLFANIYDNQIDFEPFLGVDIEVDYRKYNSFMTVEGDFLQNLVNIQNIELASSALISPNPCIGSDIIKVNLESLNNLKNSKLLVYNSMGQLLYSQDIDDTNIYIEASSFSQGPNYVIIDNGKRRIGNILVKN